MPRNNRENSSYRMLLILTAILSLASTDSVVLGILSPAIKGELHLSDTQLGLLGGIAFSLFYSVVGIPLARIADRRNRVTIIAASGFAWSVMIMLCGLAANFGQLLIARIGVAVGEAGCAPASYSLITDTFERSKRTKAISLYLLGGNFSFFLGYGLVGWLSTIVGWRYALLALGLVGLPPAIAARAFIAEPRINLGMSAKGSEDRIQSGGAEGHTPLNEVVGLLARSRVYLHLLASFCLASFFSSGLLQWMPSFFIRSFGFDIGHIGLVMAVIWGGGGMLGTFLGGELASKYAPYSEAKQLTAVALCYVAFSACNCLVFASASPKISLVAAGVAALGVGLTNGPIIAVLQGSVPKGMRATATAFVYLFSNLVGLGLGPLAVGFISDHLAPFAGSESLRFALLLMSPGYLWGAWHVWRAARATLTSVSALPPCSEEVRARPHASDKQQECLNDAKA